MLQALLALLAALGVTVGANGIGTAAQHATPAAADRAIVALAAALAHTADTVTVAATGLELAVTKVTNERALEALAAAAEAKAAGQAKADAARPEGAGPAEGAGAPEGAGGPPFDAPPTDGQPADPPPVVTPVGPPIDPPGKP